MGAARKEFELPVDGLLKYLPREARLGFAASLDVSENNVDKLPEPEEAPALPRLRVGKELIANDVGEARHPRSLIPERIFDTARARIFSLDRTNNRARGGYGHRCSRGCRWLLLDLCVARHPNRAGKDRC